MTDLHPHWHATPDDEEPVRVSARVPVAAASRLPAAFAGIAVFAAIGLTVSGGWQALQAQVSGDSTASTASSSSAAADTLAPVLVRITPAGFVPAEAVVRPGQSIVWKNEQTIPHILTSQTLRNSSGGYLNTPAIFPDSDASFVVGDKEISRTHNYGSTTDISLKGKIVVQKAVTASAPAGNGPFGTLDDVPLPTGGVGTSPIDRPTPQFPGSPTPVAAVIPAPLPPITNTPIQDIAPVPPSVTVQPETGPEVWVVVLLTVAGLYAATRSYFRRIGTEL